MRVLIVVLTLLLPGLASADFGFELRAAALFPQDSRLRDVYQEEWPEYGIEFFYKFCGSWELFNDLNYSWVHGRSTCLKKRTELSMWSDYIGVKYIWCPFDCLDLSPYFGIGGGYVNVHFRNNSRIVSRKVNRSGGGLILKSGFEYYFCECFFLDLFADYTYNWIDNRKRRKDRHQLNNDMSNNMSHNHQHNDRESNRVRTGGFKVGLGIGVEF